MYDIISLLHDVCIKQCLWWGLIFILGLGDLPDYDHKSFVLLL